MATDSKPRTISLKEIDKQLQQGLDGTDTARAGALAGLARVRAAKQTGLQRERDRLAKTLPADDPELAALDQKLMLNKALTRELDSAAGRAATSVPTAADDRYILHGHVRNVALEPQPGLTVAIYDVNGTWLQQAGYACTDANGYFLLVVKSGGKGQGTSNGGTVLTHGLQAAAQAPSSYFAYVLDAKGSILYRDSDPLDLRLGGLDYREIVLGNGGTASCAPPPGGTGPTPGGDGTSKPPTDAKPTDSKPTAAGSGGAKKSAPAATVVASPGTDAVGPAKPVVAPLKTPAVAKTAKTSKMSTAKTKATKKVSTAKKPTGTSKTGGG